MRPRGKKAVKNAGSTKWGRRLKVLLASPVLAAAIAVGIPAYEDAHDHPDCTPTITQNSYKDPRPRRQDDSNHHEADETVPEALIRRPLRCTECSRDASEVADGWKTYLTSDEPPELATYCPECAERGFAANA